MQFLHLSRYVHATFQILCRTLGCLVSGIIVPCTELFETAQCFLLKQMFGGLWIFVCLFVCCGFVLAWSQNTVIF